MQAGKGSANKRDCDVIYNKFRWREGQLFCHTTQALNISSHSDFQLRFINLSKQKAILQCTPSQFILAHLLRYKQSI